jgi:preprotein translocase SecE subunit
MASVKDEAEKDLMPMAADLVASDAQDPEEDDDKKKPSKQIPDNRPRGNDGFFTIYKKGQGKWTRLGTIFVAAFLGCLTAYNINTYLQPYVPAVDANHSQATVNHISQLFLGISIASLGLFGLLVYWITNKPQNADFLIATDSEMKKVNWTTKGELVGSTRVVVLFLIFIAVFLFAVDIVFQEFFSAIHVLIRAQ